MEALRLDSEGLALRLRVSIAGPQHRVPVRRCEIPSSFRSLEVKTGESAEIQDSAVTAASAFFKNFYPALLKKQSFTRKIGLANVSQAGSGAASTFNRTSAPPGGQAQMSGSESLPDRPKEWPASAFAATQTHADGSNHGPISGDEAVTNDAELESTGVYRCQ